MRSNLLGLTILVSCSSPQKVVLSRGTTPPSFLRDAALADVVGYYGRTDESGTMEGTAILMDYSYLRAYAYQQGRARFDSDEEIEGELRSSHERYGGQHTSFAVRIGIESDLGYSQGSPLLDLTTWSFRLRDGRGRTERARDVETATAQGRTQVQSVPTWGGALAYTRHSYQLQGAVRFAYVLDRRAGWVSLHAYPPGLDEEPLVFVWLLK